MSVRGNGGGSGGGAEGSGSDDFTDDEHNQISDIGQSISKKYKTAKEQIDSAELEDEYGDFRLPPTEKNAATPSPIDVVFGSDESVIYPEDLPKYNEILKKGTSQSKALQSLQKDVDRANQIIRDALNRTKTVYRGTSVEELKTIAEENGKIGMGERTEPVIYAKDDFVSTSVDSKAAKDFADIRSVHGIVIKMDVSEMDESDYEPCRYETRRDIMAYDPERPKRNPIYKSTYRPDEKFGGSHAAFLIPEAEIRLRKKTIPRIREIRITMNSMYYTPEVRADVEKAVKKLNDTHGWDIKINYTPSTK